MADRRRQSRIRPQLYVHMEFGVSWNADQPPRNHEVTYRSRGLRERLPPFPRPVPAPNTNYLFNAPQPQLQPHPQPQPPPHPQLHPQPQHPRQPPVPYDWDMFYGYYAPPPYQARDPRRQQHDEVSRRTSRSDSRSSHERGQSAPPPINNSPWDVSVSQQPLPQPQPRASYQSTSSSERPPPEVWKALPEIPTRFRLGEDSLPWGAWSVPYGYDPEAHPQDDDEHQSRAGPPSRSASTNVASATSPTEVSTFSPGPSGPGFRPDDPGRVHELSTLGAALMTVDNGFENQWWNQGQRESVDTGDVVGETMQDPQRFSRNSLGWAVASTAGGSNSRVDRLSLATTDVMVSPLPSFASPDSGAVHPALARSLSTRSDELFFTERVRGLPPG